MYVDGCETARFTPLALAYSRTRFQLFPQLSLLLLFLQCTWTETARFPPAPLLTATLASNASPNSLCSAVYVEGRETARFSPHPS